MKAIYPGTFDPITYGHIDIIERVSHLYNEIIVAIYEHETKSPLMSLDERITLTKQTLEHLPNIKIIPFSDMLIVDLAKKMQAKVILRGLRALSDFEYEIALAQTNKKLAPDIETIFLMTSHEYSYISSSLVKELARLGGDISHMAPSLIQSTLKKNFRNSNLIG